MKAILGFGLMAVWSFARGQAKLDVYVNGQKAGSASVSQRIAADGGKVVDLNMTIDGDGKEVTVRSESVYDKAGAPLREYQETVTTGKGRHRREVIATFDADGANVVLDEDGNRSTKHVSLLSTASRADSSEFWFTRDAPKVADSVRAYRFNPDSLNWELVNTTYKGVRPITVDGRKVTAFVTDSEEGTAYLDQDGLPLRIEMPNAAMERTWETSQTSKS